MAWYPKKWWSILSLFFCCFSVFASDISLSLFTYQRYYGPDDLIYLVGKIENNIEEDLRNLKVKIDVVKEGKVKKRLSDIQIEKLLKKSERCFVVEVETKGLDEGEYTLIATLSKDGKELASSKKEVIIEKWKVPEWVKRARLFWQHAWIRRPPYWRSVSQMKGEIISFAESGASVVDNQCCQVYYNASSPSYPLTVDLSEVVDTCHQLGMKYIWYQTSCTASEYFIYQHRNWLEAPPFYTCGWLSFPPGCPKWSEHLGKDLGELVSRAGIDGIMLDNANAVPPPSGEKDYYQKQYDKIATHLTVLRNGIKKQKAWAALIPNFNTFAVYGLKSCSKGWDGMIKEGDYAVALKDAKGEARYLKDFIYRFSRVRELTGKPVLPLCYPSNKYYANLSVGATIAAGCTPGSESADKEYYWFVDRYQEYFYSPCLIPIGKEKVLFSPDDEDTAVVVYEKVYRNGLKDYVVHILNAKNEDKEVKVVLDISYNLSTGYIITPLNPLPKKINITKDNESNISFMVNSRPWSVVLLTSEISPLVEKISPKVIEVTQGEEMPFQIEVKNPNTTELKGKIYFRLPHGISISPEIKEFTISPSEVKKEVFRISVDSSLNSGVKEFFIRVDYGEREMELPYEVVIKEPIEIKIKPDHFAYTEKNPYTTITLVNNSRERKEGVITIKTPEGWSIQPNSDKFTLNSGEKKNIVCKIEQPGIILDGYFDIRDYTFEIEIDEGKTEAKKIPIRLHQPIVCLISCDLGSSTKDIVQSGAGEAPISQFLFPVRGIYHTSDLKDAIKKADEYLDKGENIVLWLRPGGKTDMLSDKEIQKSLEKFVGRGGGLLLQENIFSASPDNLQFLESDICQNPLNLKVE